MSKIEDHDLQAALRLMMRRVATTLEETASNFPLFVTDDSESHPKWFTTSDGNWCAGYWIGLLWLAAKHAQSENDRQKYVKAAYAHITAMSPQPTKHLFAGLNHYYAGFLGFDLLGDSELMDLGIRGADAMLELYNCKAQQIPIGQYATAPTFSNSLQKTMPLDRSYLAAVDAVHTSLPVLWRAYAETQRPEYREVALAHTRRHLEWHIRADGSTAQMSAFDPKNGAKLNSFSPLGEKDSGCWSRGLAWSIAGLAQAYVSTGDLSFLDAIERSMSFYVRHAAGDLVPAWDFNHPDPNANRDSSAAAVVVYGLLLLRGRPDSRTQDLDRLGLKILDSLLEGYFVWDDSASNSGAILHGCYRYASNVAVDNELIWSNFYVATALDMLVSPGSKQDTTCDDNDRT